MDLGTVGANYSAFCKQSTFFLLRKIASEATENLNKIPSLCIWNRRTRFGWVSVFLGRGVGCSREGRAAFFVPAIQGQRAALAGAAVSLLLLHHLPCCVTQCEGVQIR